MSLFFFLYGIRIYIWSFFIWIYANVYEFIRSFLNYRIREAMKVVFIKISILGISLLYSCKVYRSLLSSQLFSSCGKIFLCEYAVEVFRMSLWNFSLLLCSCCEQINALILSRISHCLVISMFIKDSFIAASSILWLDHEKMHLPYAPSTY